MQISDIAGSQKQFKFRKINDKMRISILSYNILADIFCKPDYFSYADPKILNFQYRSVKIIEEIKQLNADFVCLQEVDHFKDFYKPQLEKLGYECIYQPKMSFQFSNEKFTKEIEEQLSKNKGKSRLEILESDFGVNFDLLDAVVIAFKKEKFKNLDFKDLVYCQELPDYLQQKNLIQYQKDHRALICKFKHLESNFEFVVANTHTYWDPKQDHVKYLQICKLLEYMDKHYFDEYPIVICGDFNSMPSSNAVQMVINKEYPLQDRNEFRKYVNIEDCEQLYEQIICKNKGKYSLKQDYKSCYQNYRNQNKFPQFTTYCQNFNGAIDHIFYNSKSKYLKVEDVLELPSQEEINQFGNFCPNKNYPSDHLPIMANFILDY